MIPVAKQKTNKKQFVEHITNPKKIKELVELTQEYNIWNSDTSDMYMTLGYTMLTSGDKVVYYYLRSLQRCSNKNFCYPSQDFLAISLNMSVRNMARHLSNLKKAGVLKIVSGKNDRKVNLYYITEAPLPDTSFMTTVQKLITRKKLKALISSYHKTTSLSDKARVIEDLQSLSMEKTEINRLLNKKHHAQYL